MMCACVHALVWTKRMLHDLGMQFDTIVVNIFGASKSMLIKIPADKLIDSTI